MVSILFLGISYAMDEDNLMLVSQDMNIFSLITIIEILYVCFI